MSDYPTGFPPVFIDDSGGVRVEDPDARISLAANPGVYRVHKTGAVVLLTLDENTGAAPRVGESLSLCGDIAHMHLLALMNMFNQNRESGRLVVKRDHVERVVMLKEGDVASVGSNLPRDRLGNWLVRLGKVNQVDLESAQDEAERGGKRIGQVLIGRGLLDAHELWASIQAQITDLFSDVLGWERGTFVLYRFPPGHRFPATPPLAMQGLMLEAVRRQDEMQVYRQRITSVDVVLAITGKMVDDDVPHDVREAYEVLAPRASVAEVAQRLQCTEFDAIKFGFQLLDRGLVEVASGDAAIAAPLSPAEQARIEVSNLAFREIFDEIVRADRVASFLGGVDRYLSDENGGYAALFHGLTLDDSGALPVEPLLISLQRLRSDGHDTNTLLGEALNELTFFMLFQCGELLDPQSDENLGRRVRLIHASLGIPPG